MRPDGKRISETGLHGGVRNAGRVAFSKELLYIHLSVDEAGDEWGKLFKVLDQDDEDRAVISGCREAPLKVKLGVDLDAKTGGEPVTAEEREELAKMVRGWVDMRKAAVIDVDSDSPPSSGVDDVGDGGAGGRRPPATRRHRGGSKTRGGSGGGPPGAAAGGPPPARGSGGDPPPGGAEAGGTAGGRPPTEEDGESGGSSGAQGGGGVPA